MSDPERLLDHGSKLEARLLASAVDEPPPPELLSRTLGLVTMAPPPAAATGAAAGGAAKGGGLLGAIAIGAALGLLVVGGFELAQRSAAPHEVRPAVAAPIAPPPVAVPPDPPPITTTKAVAPIAAPSAPRSLTLAAELALLDEARSALRAGDRAGARALLDRYAREIPRGQLGREAALLREETEAVTGIDAGPTDR
jgi:hypothetical protein